MGHLPEDLFIQVVKNAPLVAIDLVVWDEHGKLLVGWRSNEPAKGFWFVPGGRIYKNERISQAFERIALEELGTTFKLGQATFIGVYEHLYENNVFEAAGFGTHYITLAYELHLDRPLANLPVLQHSHYRWMTVEEIRLAQDVHPNTKAYLG